jgi:dolichyl-phosphate-mannose-protein mannosyltransferase
MQDVGQRRTELDWRTLLRQAAIGADRDERRRVLLSRLAWLGTLAFVVLLIGLPGQWGLSSRGLDDVRQVADQAQRGWGGGFAVDGLYPLLYPLWLLVVARFTNDLELAARLLSGIGAVASLFLVYQLCHGQAQPDKADELSCFALLTLALTPTFFLAAAGGGTEVPHLALLLATLLLVQRAMTARDEMVPMALAGLSLGLSVLIRPASLLALPAVLLWLWLSNPFGADERSSNLRAALGFGAAFLSAPRRGSCSTWPRTAAAWPGGRPRRTSSCHACSAARSSSCLGLAERSGRTWPPMTSSGCPRSAAPGRPATGAARSAR